MNYLYQQDVYVSKNATSADEYFKLEAKAEEMYSSFRNMTDDIEKISSNIGWSIEDITNVKNHVYNKIGKNRC